MTDNHGIDIGDIPVPAEPDSTDLMVPDAFGYNVAFKMAFVGVGQCGGRIAATFNKLGYGSVCAINTTIQDLRELKLSEDKKFDIGGAQGAGKNPAIAAQLLHERMEEVHELYRRCWGPGIDYAFVCFAAAGGTGAGAFPGATSIARAYLQELHRPVRLGAIVALPKDSEGQRYARNALITVKKLREQNYSPVLIIDNQRIKELFPKTAPSQEHDRFNTSTANLLHIFNRLAGSDSEHTTFDRADLARLLDSGLVACGAHTITSWASANDICVPIRDQLRRNLLTAADIEKSKLAGLIYVLNGSAYDEVQSAYLDQGSAMLTRMLGSDSTILQGIYRGAGTGAAINALIMVGGLPWPEARLRDLARVAGICEGDGFFV